MVFDGKNGSARRRSIFPDYKANRKVKIRLNRSETVDKEDNQLKQLLRLIQYLEIMPITTMTMDGSEADDVIAYLANDIIEPQDWLAKKLEALQTYPKAGIVASSLDQVRHTIQSEHIISNWLLSMEVVNKIGIFNESMFPYGPIDLDYCERANLSGFNTYYVMNCKAEHQGCHASGDEYGWDKGALVQKYWQQHVEDVYLYRNGLKDLKHGNKRTEDKQI